MFDVHRTTGPDAPHAGTGPARVEPATLSLSIDRVTLAYLAYLAALTVSVVA